MKEETQNLVQGENPNEKGKIKPPTPKPRKGRQDVNESVGQKDVKNDGEVIESSETVCDNKSNTEQKDVNDFEENAVKHAKKKGKNKESQREDSKNNTVDIPNLDGQVEGVENNNDSIDQGTDENAADISHKSSTERKHIVDKALINEDQIVDRDNKGESASDNEKSDFTSDNGFEKSTDRNSDKRYRDGDTESSTSSNASDNGKLVGDASGGPNNIGTPQQRRLHLLSGTGHSGSIELDLPSVSQQPSRQPSGRSDQSDSAMSLSDIVLQDSPSEGSSSSHGPPGKPPLQQRKSTFSGHSTLVDRSVPASSVPSEAGGDDDDSVNVVIRVRPLNPAETTRGDKVTVQFPGDGGVWIDTGSTTKSFTFNVTFEPEASQEDVFNHSGIKKLIDMALTGYSCTAFAFGQTGSGKTHTITGPPHLFEEANAPDPSQFGLIARSFQYLFKSMDQNPLAKGYRIKAHYLEIYNEQVVDLLNPNSYRPLLVRWSKNRGFYVENLFTIQCESIDDLMAVLDEG